MNDFTRHAATELFAKADALGVPVPDEARQLVHLCGTSNGGALLYANAHPDADDPTVPDLLRFCCMGSASGDLSDCTCWEPTYTVEQQPPQVITDPREATPRRRVCGDCAFRKDSPERATEYEEEALFALADRGTPFWCHDGMRRPLVWRHPAGVEIAGDPDDWQPPKVAGIPYRTDGQPALLCAGWAARATRAKETSRG